MSTFAVTVEQIERVWPHPNADRLELASVKGLAYQFCIGKGEYKPGDSVVYIPIDAVLPDAIVDRLGVRNFLAGGKRVKTAKLRGQISQGLVCKVESLMGDGHEWAGLGLNKPGADLASYLGIVKYEPPEIFITGAKLLPLPYGLGYYDIEGADRFMNVVEMLMDRPCYITEKLEGSNETVLLTLEGALQVCTHGHLIMVEEGAANTYVDTALRCGHMKLLSDLALQRPDCRLALRGELIGPGIQKNIYGLAKHEIRLFDVKVDGAYMDPDTFEAAIQDAQQRVPVLSKGPTLREWLAGRTLQEASNGMSLLNPKTRREGVVIKPMVEDYVDFGDGHPQRLLIKQRSPEYLAKEAD
jgi:RNA ligase (TIGR02306 family)